MAVLLSVFPMLLNIVYIAVQVLFACAAYQDAKSLNNKDATLWSVLIGILGLIPGIIYLCIRRRSTPPVVSQICSNCRVPLVPGTIICPYCGAQQNAINPYLWGYRSPEECAECHEKAKRLLIAAIICAVVLVALFVLIIVLSVSVGMDDYSYYDYSGGIY